MKTISFKSARAFRDWLAKNHSQSSGLLLQIYKKDSGVPTVTYAQALDQALCYGWIDGQKKPGDQQSWLQIFMPRRPKSGWSKNNTAHAERLISGAMTAAGLKEVEAAKSDGRWQAAYDAFGSATGAGRFFAAARQKQEGQGVLCDAEQDQPLFHRLPAADREETGNPRQAHADDHRHAGARRKISLKRHRASSIDL
jgi:hypothetical protein